MLKLIALFLSAFFVASSAFAEDSEEEVQAEEYFDYVENGLCFAIESKYYKTAVVKNTRLKSKRVKNDGIMYQLSVPAYVYIDSVKYKVTEIGDNVFRKCKNLESIEIAKGITRINAAAFAYCDNLRSVILPDSLEWIGEQAFMGDSLLERIALPNSLKFLGYEAFNGCSKLDTVAIPALVGEFGPSVFVGCSNLKAVLVDSANAEMCSADGRLYTKDMSTLICCPDGDTTAFVIPQTLTKIRWQFTESKLNCVRCMSSVPPMGDFKDSGKLKLPLFVPRRSVMAYKQDIYWSRFDIHPY